MRSHSILLALLLLMGLGCDSPTEPNTPDAFIAVVRRVDPVSLQPHAAGVADNMVVVDGHIITADPCHAFAATTARQQRTLTITLHARPNSAGCLQPAGEWNYRITVPNVAAGNWRVVVQHSFATGSISETVIDDSVDVPPGA